MHIFVSTLDGKTLKVNIESSDTVNSIKAHVHDQEGIPPASQRLIFSGKPLEGSRPLSYYKIKKGNTVHLGTSLTRFLPFGCSNIFSDA
jgi:hypothetical protein